MSIEALKWALDVGEQHALEPTTRHVLIILANRADEEGALFPSIAWICKRTGLARSTVREHLRILRENKPPLLEASARLREDQSHTSNDYRLPLGQPGLLLEGGSDDHRRGWAGSRPTPGRQPTQGGPAGGPRETKPIRKTKKKVATGPKRAPAGQPTPVANTWNAYLKAMKERYGAEPASSASTMGQLSQVVARVGAEAAPEVARAYVQTGGFYERTGHDPAFLLRDCKRLDLELRQRKAGGRPKSVPLCDYCGEQAVGMVHRHNHCRAHTNDALDDKQPQAVAA